MEDSKVIELLMSVSDKVTAIGTNMEHMKQDIQEIKQTMEDKNSSFDKRISNVEQKVTQLENKGNLEDAKKWRKATGYVLAVLGTSVVTFLLAHIGDLITTLGGK